jgi:signal transduction histidine kinase
MVGTSHIQGERFLEDLVDSEERERARIAGEIHDDPVQVLDAVSLRLQAAESQASEELTKSELRAARQAVLLANARLRLLMFELLPPADVHELPSAVESYCAQLFASTGIAWEVGGDPGPLSTRRAQLAYRLVQEALRNTVKHARAGRVLVSFAGDACTFLTRVSDDGVGLPANAEMESEPVGASALHAGLRLVRQRARVVGGSVTIAQGLGGRGTAVEIVLPRGERRA